MDTLTLTTVCILCTAPATASHPGDWKPLIAEAANRFGVPETWIGKVMQAESGGHTLLNGQPITSRAGAMGLMQIMPDTYVGLQQRYGLGADPYSPRDNILAGAAYLKEMYVRYGYPNLFAAYNMGPGRFDRFLLRHTPLPAETLRYVDSIIPSGSLAFGGAVAIPLVSKSATPAALFVALNGSTPAVASIEHVLTAAVPDTTNPTAVTTATRASLFVTLTLASRQQ